MDLCGIDEGNHLSSGTESHVSTIQICLRIEYIEEGRTYRKQIQFSLLNPQDVVKLSEFQVTHRDLYTAVDRLPVKDGVLDRRLVRLDLTC